MKVPSGYILLMESLFRTSAREPFRINYDAGKRRSFVTHLDGDQHVCTECLDQDQSIWDGAKIPPEVYVPTLILMKQGRGNLAEHLFSSFYGKRCYVRFNSNKSLGVVDSYFNLLAFHNNRDTTDNMLLWLYEQNETDFSPLAANLTKAMFQGEVISRTEAHAQEYLDALVNNLLAFTNYRETIVSGKVLSDGYYIQYKTDGTLYRMDFVKQIQTKVKQFSKDPHSEFLEKAKDKYQHSTYVLDYDNSGVCFVYKGYGLCQPYSYYVTDTTGVPLYDFKANRVNLFDKLLGARPHIR